MTTEEDGFSPRGTEQARIIPVIETTSVKITDNIARYFHRYWSLGGELLAENDEWKKEQE